jgi:hypothetical protein
MSLTTTPSPTTADKPLVDPVYYRLVRVQIAQDPNCWAHTIAQGSQQLNRPAADSRRAVSLQASVEVEEKPVNYPGEGLIIFPVQRSTANQHGDGGKSEAASFARR